MVCKAGDTLKLFIPRIKEELWVIQKLHDMTLVGDPMVSGDAEVGGVGVRVKRGWGTEGEYKIMLKDTQIIK